MKPILFSEQQRSALAGLGLVPQSIDEIERDALPRAREILKLDPPGADVLHELQGLEKSLNDARAAIERLLNANRTVPHLWHARSRVCGRGFGHVGNALRLKETAKSLAVAIDVVKDSIASTPPGPVRHRAATTLPIQIIHSAYQLGLMLAGLDPASGGMKPSVSPTSDFRRMVGICYEAIDASTTDPERAIKAYLRKWRELEKVAAEAGSGQNVLEEPDVLS